ncbi:uncharacterized protein LOC123532565 [Mercenaria mercenaria]|uniref:uncharacterized protein LOC123532565 n=1 Tax=Mercenaria mercenaria TaxID=6596 RepID=UPI00234E3BBA|nr:uncharacterized protein LOC123532565 [Mercenaria mercenaria]XP_053374661.1 uncharacterized protein LOC123532565 [Mercenaria mercenaria]
MMEEKSKVHTETGNNAFTVVRAGTFFGSKILYILLITLHVVWFGVGVAKLVIGPMYINDCDLEKMIPIWVIVDAFTPILLVVGFIPFYKDSNSDAMKKFGAACLVIGTIFSIGWTICGAVVIYPNWNDGGDCDTRVATFAFASMCINWSIIGMWSQLVGRLLFYTFSRSGRKTSDESQR